MEQENLRDSLVNAEASSAAATRSRLTFLRGRKFGILSITATVSCLWSITAFAATAPASLDPTCGKCQRMAAFALCAASLTGAAICGLLWLAARRSAAAELPWVRFAAWITWILFAIALVIVPFRQIVAG